MNYTVTAWANMGDAGKSESAKSESKAIKIAQEWAKSGKYATVYISFYRETDGQHGYINENGADFTGRNWVHIED